MTVPLTIFQSVYVLRMVESGEYVCELLFAPSKKGRRPVLSFAAQKRSIDQAPHFNGGRRLNAILREAARVGQPMFPVKVDR